MSLEGWHAGVGSARSIASDAAHVKRYTDVLGHDWERALQGVCSWSDSTKAKGPVLSREPSATRRHRQQWSRLTLRRQASTRQRKLDELKRRSSLTLYIVIFHWKEIFVVQAWRGKGKGRMDSLSGHDTSLSPGEASTAGRLRAQEVAVIMLTTRHA